MDLLSRLGLTKPLVLAPMAAGPSTPQLVAAVSNSGGLGSLGCAYDSPEAILDLATQTKQQTQKSFAINLFVPQEDPEVSNEEFQRAIKATSIYRSELNIPTPKELGSPYSIDFDSQFESMLKAKPHVFSFIFGIPRPEYLKETHRNNIAMIGTATSLEEALKLQEAGVDAITVQGFQAGGHRGIFSANGEDPEIPTEQLLEDLKGKIKIPIIAGGGIMTREHIQRILQKGATAVQMGTAFLAVSEAGTSNVYRKKLLENSKRETKTTRAFSGRLARGIVNRFMTDMDRKPDVILPFPAQNKFTRDIRNAASLVGNPECLSLWSGAGEGDLYTGNAIDLINSLFG